MPAITPQTQVNLSVTALIAAIASIAGMVFTIAGKDKDLTDARNRVVDLERQVSVMKCMVGNHREAALSAIGTLDRVIVHLSNSGSGGTGPVLSARERGTLDNAMNTLNRECR